MSEKIRTFLAVPFGSFYKSELSKVVSELKAKQIDAKWVRVEDVHLTLQFFGYLAGEKIGEIKNALAPGVEKLRAFELWLEGFGGFPGLRNPRVLWIGFGGEAGKLIQLKALTDECLKKIKVPTEDREFKPHLTLARLKSPLGEDGNILLRDYGSFKCERKFRVAEVVLFKSDLTPEGPLYTRLHTFSLNGQA
ncbi:MAG: RNA 2',3'-cyclic phosphodiesterase [Candidatus Omnitrophica bacterium]|nr:RNA 2',3'-cyclic phosphodiesterase [Candidatus Omnitrophota bacterium]